MQFDVFRAVWRHFFQFCNAADGVFMTAFTFPDVQWCTPVSVTGDTPVLNIFQPVAKTAFADGLWNPVDCIVVADTNRFGLWKLKRYS